MQNEKGGLTSRPFRCMIGVYYTPSWKGRLMSKGNRVVPVRMEPALVDLVTAAIAGRNSASLREPWSFSDFVRIAIKEKLAHMQRSRAGKGKRKGAANG